MKPEREIPHDIKARKRLNSERSGFVLLVLERLMETSLLLIGFYLLASGKNPLFGAAIFLTMLAGSAISIEGKLKKICERMERGR